MIVLLLAAVILTCSRGHRACRACSVAAAVIAINCRARLMARGGVIAMEDVISDMGAVGRGDQSRGAHPQHARLAVAAEVIAVALDAAQKKGRLQMDRFAAGFMSS